jgi:hypothetical protein
LNNSHRLLFVNYFIDSDHLVIEEKNIFTATELATVIPLHGADYYHSLQIANDSWLKKYFPNLTLRPTTGVSAGQPGWLKKSIETLIGFLLGNTVDKFLMKLAHRRWRKLYGHQYREADFEIAFKTKRYASKNHPNQYQKKVLMLHQNRIDAFREKFEIG